MKSYPQCQLANSIVTLAFTFLLLLAVLMDVERNSGPFCTVLFGFILDSLSLKFSSSLRLRPARVYKHDINIYTYSRETVLVA